MKKKKDYELETMPSPAVAGNSAEDAWPSHRH
jgi:hypothetical protein